MQAGKLRHRITIQTRTDTQDGYGQPVATGTSLVTNEPAEKRDLSGRELGFYLQMPYPRRDHPMVAMVQQAFGWTDAEVDALFVEADAV